MGDHRLGDTSQTECSCSGVRRGSPRPRPLALHRRHEVRHSASGASRFPFFLSVWKHGVAQGRHRVHRHLLQFGGRRGGEGQRQRRLRGLSREAGANRWPGECGSWPQACAGPRSPPGALPVAFPVRMLTALSPSTLLLHPHSCSKDTAAFPGFQGQSWELIRGTGVGA